MFSNAYLHVQAQQCLLFLLIPLAAYATYQNRKLSFFAVYLVGAWLLVYKICEYATTRRVPMDLSALCYFFYGAGALLPVRPLKTAAAQVSFLCGIGFCVTNLVAPQIFQAREPVEMWRDLAVVNHSLLLFGGLAMMGHIPFKPFDFVWTLAALVGFAIDIAICEAMGAPVGNAVFLQIVDGSIILVPAPNFSMPWWYYIVYYTILSALMAGFIYMSYAVNRAVFPRKRHQKIGFFAV